MHRQPIAVLACVAGAVAIAVGGCGSPSQRLPTACIQGPAAVERALQQAPGAVTINGTRISQCFVRNASSDDVQVVGTFLLTAAQQLAVRAEQGERRPALQLGYLIGAAQRGAAHNGVSSELIRRLDAETAGLDKVRASFEQGLRAGLARG